MKSTTKQLCFTALFTAIVCVCTMVVTIPTPTSNGYIHLGDGIIFCIAVVFGGPVGIISAGIGSALADILLGYPQWFVFSFIIKSIMAFVVIKFSKENNLYSVKTYIGVVIGCLIMIFGYFLAGILLNSGVVASVGAIPSNVVQAIGGIITYSVLAPVFKKYPNIHRCIITKTH